MDAVTLPKDVDEPITMLIWSADEFVPVTMMLGLGMVIGQVTIMLLLSYFVIRLYRRFRDNRQDGLPLHLAYWIGLLPSKAITVPNPYVREFLP
jgi:conjugal transfer pilus assembly protein TraL